MKTIKCHFCGEETLFPEKLQERYICACGTIYFICFLETGLELEFETISEMIEEAKVLSCEEVETHTERHFAFPGPAEAEYILISVQAVKKV